MENEEKEGENPPAESLFWYGEWKERRWNPTSRVTIIVWGMKRKKGENPPAELHFCNVDSLIYWTLFGYWPCFYCGITAEWGCCVDSDVVTGYGVTLLHSCTTSINVFVQHSQLSVKFLFSFVLHKESVIVFTRQDSTVTVVTNIFIIVHIC